MTAKDEFLAAFAALEQTQTARAESEIGYQSSGCLRSPATMFSERCVDCYRCLHCKGLRWCVNCTHCADSERLHGCSHCRRSRDCSGCNFVVWSVGCHDCNYCFGCVGLVRKEFHILNVKYDRSEYFARVDALLRALGEEAP